MNFSTQASLSFTISRSLLKLMSLEPVTSSSCLILCCPLLLLPSIFPSIRVFSTESSLHIRGPKYWSFSFSISLYTLLYIKQTNNKDLPHSAEKSVQCYLEVWMGGEVGGEWICICICMAEALCCPPETVNSMTLLIRYTPV